VDESVTAPELARISKRQRDPRMRTRVAAIRYLRLGHTVPETAKAFGMSERQVRNWVHRYNTEGVEGLRDRPRPGQPPHLAPDLVEQFKERVRSGPGAEDGVCAFRGVNLQRILQQEFQAEYSLPGVYFLLHRLGFSSLVPRPKHRQADEQAQAAFKKTSLNTSKRPKRSTPPRRSKSGSKMKRASVNRGR
jgi:transposase